MKIFVTTNFLNNGNFANQAKLTSNVVCKAKAVTNIEWKCVRPVQSDIL